MTRELAELAAGLLSLRQQVTHPNFYNDVGLIFYIDVELMFYIMF